MEQPAGTPRRHVDSSTPPPPNRVAVVSRWLSRFIAEWYPVITVVVGAFIAAYEQLGALGKGEIAGAAIASLGLILVIHKTAKDVDSIKTAISVVSEQNQALRQLPLIVTRQERAHLKATRDTAKRMFDLACELASKVNSIDPYKGGEIKIVDHNPISTLLLNLGKRLPDGAIWLGTTLVTAGWQERLEDRDDLTDFAREMQRRARNGEIKVCRIYCVRSESELVQIAEHLQREVASNTIVRYYVYQGEQPPDMTLAFSAGTIEPQAPARALLDCGENAGLFALRFDVAPPTVVRKVTLFEPGDDEFTRSVPFFDQIFEKSTPYGKV